MTLAKISAIHISLISCLRPVFGNNFKFHVVGLTNEQELEKAA